MFTRTLLAAAVLLGVPAAHAQPAGQGDGDFVVTVTGTPAIAIPPAATTRSGISFQVQGAGTVACRPGTIAPGFDGGSYLLRGDTGTPAVGASAFFTGPFADPRAWSCVAYPVGGGNTAVLMIKVYP